MGGLLHTARKFLRGITPALPDRAQMFAVACSRGHRLSGVRTDGYQALRCPTCGEGMFVLPRSPLPEPAGPSAPVTRRRTTTSSAFPSDDGPVALSDPVPMSYGEGHEGDEVGEIEWLDGSEGAPAGPTDPVGDPFESAKEELVAQTSTGAKTPSATTTAKKPVHAAERLRKAREEPRAVAVALPAVSVADRLRRHRNPLIFVAVALIVLGTVAYRVRQAGRAELPRIAERGRLEGLEALDAGQFDKAQHLLSQARRAVDELGDAYQGASAIRQGADEAEVISKLAPASLEEMLDEAARSDAKEWSERFATLYKGRTLILDAHIKGVPDGRGLGSYDLDYRIFRAGEGGRPRSFGRVDLAGFRLFELTKPRAGDHVTFGARLASFHFDLQGEEWLVGLEPSSGVLMTHAKALEALGWSSPDSAIGEEDRP